MALTLLPRLLGISGICALPLVWAGCGDPAAPTPDPSAQVAMADVVGSYRATTLVTEENGTGTDQIARGSSLDLSLDASGVTGGRLFVPQGGEDGGDFDADLTGTWTLEGNMVAFSHNADTFVRDMPFTYGDGRLWGDKTFGATRIRVVLKKP